MRVSENQMLFLSARKYENYFSGRFIGELKSEQLVNNKQMNALLLEMFVKTQVVERLTYIATQESLPRELIAVMHVLAGPHQRRVLMWADTMRGRCDKQFDCCHLIEWMLRESCVPETILQLISAVVAAKCTTKDDFAKCHSALITKLRCSSALLIALYTAHERTDGGSLGKHVLGLMQQQRTKSGSSVYSIANMLDFISAVHSQQREAKRSMRSRGRGRA